MAFDALFATAASQVTVFNAPGFKDTQKTQDFFARFGSSIPNNPDIQNVIADEANVGSEAWSRMAGLHSRPGIAIEIAIENQWLSDEPSPPDARNHSQQTLTDALAVHATFERLDSTLTTDKFKGVLAASANGTAASLERLVDTLEVIFGINSIPLDVGNAHRDALYQAIYRLQDPQQTPLFDQAAGLVEINLLAGMDAATLANLAKGNIAYRYALAHLNPFAITGDNALFAQHNTNGELDIYDPSTREGTLTDKYLEDRAALLHRLLERNTADALVNQPGETQIFDTNHRVPAWSGSGGVSHLYPSIRFGSDAGDQLQGGSQEDHLYGMAGDDVLEGHGGTDHLEGGEGDDTYIAGDGDTILDTDGIGRVLIGNQVLFGGTRRPADAPGHFTDTGSGVTYQLVDQILTVTTPEGEVVTIENFTPGDLGIFLGDAVEEPEPTHTIEGTEFDDDLAGGSGNTDTIWLGLGGSDWILAGGGHDHLYGGADPDRLEGEDGHDLLVGGTGNDILSGDAGDDRLYVDEEVTDLPAFITENAEGTGTGARGEWASGGLGNDTVVGGDGNDVVMGGGGTDVLVGGRGDDVIDGDLNYYPTDFDWSVSATANPFDTHFNPILFLDDARADGAADVIYAGAGADRGTIPTTWTVQTTGSMRMH